jgi:hypothetical protein
MTIVKSKHAGNYTVIPNEIFKSDLSVEAIGLLSYFLSCPHDWVIHKTTIHTQLNMGREKLDRVFKELTKAGYLVSEKVVNEKGQFTYKHIIYDVPYTEKPLTVKPYTVKPYTANQQLISKDIQSTNILKKDKKEEIKNKELSKIEIIKNINLNTERFSLITKQKNISIEELHKYWNQFIEYLIINKKEQDYKGDTENEAIKHFNNWLKFNLTKTSTSVSIGKNRIR